MPLQTLRSDLRQMFSASVKLSASLQHRNCVRYLKTTGCCRLKPEQNPAEEFGPIKFSGSKAQTMKARENFYSRKDRPKYEPLVISVSLATFLVYFCILREENDLDNTLNKSLYSQIEGLEEKQLQVNINYYKQEGQDTSQFERRLQELKEQNQKNKPGYTVTFWKKE